MRKPINLEHVSPTKGNYEEDEPDPEENLTDDSFEQNKLLPNSNQQSKANPVSNLDMYIPNATTISNIDNGPIDPSGKKQ